MVYGHGNRTAATRGSLFFHVEGDDEEDNTGSTAKAEESRMPELNDDSNPGVKSLCPEVPKPKFSRPKRVKRVPSGVQSSEFSGSPKKTKFMSHDEEQCKAECCRSQGGKP